MFWMSNSAVASGRGKNKRKWTDDKHEQILDLILELKSVSWWRCEGDFKSGFLKYLEDKYEIHYPKSAMTVSQIESKLKWMKEKQAFDEFWEVNFYDKSN